MSIAESMTSLERVHIIHEMAKAKFPFTGNPYSAHEVFEVYGPVVSAEEKRLIADYLANGDNSELAQEVARRQSVEA
jgi:hypothetical protein